MLPVNPGSGNPFFKLALPLFATVAGATALGAVALYRAVTRHKLAVVVHPRAPNAIPRATIVVESDGPVRECTDVPW